MIGAFQVFSTEKNWQWWMPAIMMAQEYLSASRSMP
jgi:hypothetical protein